MLDQELVRLTKSCLASPSGTASVEETDACAEFVRMCAPIIRDKMRLVHDAHHEIADCEQDAWTVVFRELPKLDFDPLRAPIIAWVSTIAERLARKLARRGRKCRNAFIERRALWHAGRSEA